MNWSRDVQDSGSTAAVHAGRPARGPSATSQREVDPAASGEPGAVPRLGELGELRGLGFELLVVQPGVEAAARDELAVRAALDDPAALEDEDPVGAQDRRQAVGDRDRRPALGERGRAPPGSAARDTVSSDDVASSRIRIRGSLSRTRAIATRCFSPPESL